MNCRECPKTDGIFYGISPERVKCSITGEFHFPSDPCNCSDESDTIPYESQVIEGATYRHFKGNYYKVLYVAEQTENAEKVVVYQALYGDHKVWVRSLKMWNEFVVTEECGIVRRFEFAHD